MRRSLRCVSYTWRCAARRVMHHASGCLRPRTFLLESGTGMAEIERTTDENWERKALEKVALAAIQEQRRARHWSIFFKLLLFIYLFALLFIWLGWTGKKESTSGKHTALVEMRGVISAESAASADSMITGLQ